MDCIGFRKAMADEWLGEAQDDFDAHRKACTDCADYARSIAALQGALRQVTGPSAPEFLWKRIQQHTLPRRRPAISIMRFVAAACAVALAVFGVSAMNADKPDPALEKIRIAEIGTADAADADEIDSFSELLVSE